MIWETICITEVLEPVDSDHVKLVEKERKYQLLGMRGEGKGLFIREEKLGKDLSSTYLTKVEKGMFIYSRLFAWKGSFALVPESLDGTFVSSEFPCFKINVQKIHPEFLLSYFKLPKVWKMVEGLSIGSTKQSRNRLKEELFLTLKIPFISRPFQDEIIIRLNEISAKASEIGQLRAKQHKDFDKLVYLDYLNLISEAQLLPFEKVSPVTRRPFEPDASADYVEIGIRSFGNGTFQKPPVKGKQIAHKSLFKMQTGDLIFSNVFAWEGAIALASEEDNVCIGSHRFITTVPDREKVNPEFLLYHLLSPKGIADVQKASPGTAGRNKTLGVSKLEKIMIPVPDIDRQNEFVELLHKVKQIKTIRRESDAELKALFPSVLDKAFKGEW